MNRTFAFVFALGLVASAIASCTQNFDQFKAVTGGGGTGATAAGGTGGTGATGGACTVECCAATDCPMPSDPCKKAVCQGSKCSEEARADGTEIATQTAHDCKKAVCQGGAVVTVNDNGDTLDDGNDCTDDVCQGGKPVSNAAKAGTMCSSKGGKVCDDMSACVGCLKDGDCPTDSPKCSNKTCVPASCGDTEKNGMETDTDCGGPQCNPCKDGDDCMIDTDCQSKICGGDKTCAVPTCTDKVHNGSEGDIDCGKDCPSQCGPKQGCNIDADCVGGVCTGMNGTCVENCQDQVKNGAETDKDCGGGTCMACDNGLACAGDNANCKSGNCQNDICTKKDINGSPCMGGGTCDSGHCVDMVCCDTTCLGECRSCNGAKTGKANGTCDDIKPNTDPDTECNNGQLCDGAGNCAKPDGTGCGNKDECISGNCVDGVCCESSCGGPCKSCNLPGNPGKCGNIANAMDPDLECAGVTTCNGNGGCTKLAKGTACTLAGECATGNCVDNFCCDTTCGGACKSCKLSGTEGTCTNIPAGTDPEMECGVGKTCNNMQMCL